MPGAGIAGDRWAGADADKVVEEIRTVEGEAMKMRAEGSPIRPLKLRVLAVMQTSFGPSTPIWPPMQAPQVAVVTMAPASISVCT